MTNDELSVKPVKPYIHRTNVSRTNWICFCNEKWWVISEASEAIHSYNKCLQDKLNLLLWWKMMSYFLLWWKMMSYQWSHEASEAINSHILIRPPKCPEQIEFASIYVCVQPITVLQDLIMSTGIEHLSGNSEQVGVAKASICNWTKVLKKQENYWMGQLRKVIRQ